MFEKKNLLRHGSATFPLKSTKTQFFSILQFYYIIFSGSKTPWLIFFFVYCVFAISFSMVSLLLSLMH